MTLVYADEYIKLEGFKIFLAGPTPREKHVKSWRPDFISLLEQKGFKGTVFIPENRDEREYDFDKQIPWEVTHLQTADLIVYWIPRDLKDMPGFTTNIEFGEFMHSGKIVVGFPKTAPNTRYIAKRSEMHHIPLFYEMEEVVDFVIVRKRNCIT